ncbi:hypothetical protein [Niabella beijingensis]|uniref:hypothetical protein n=1 Tax=Niabella beijingensis TaxID=2872700 RepID=UPI001CBB159C|nr:hypothetical protein [Niabella beijingensis]MBZ4189526.1 hypothetical protein [Niabella beijingensis]
MLRFLFPVLSFCCLQVKAQQVTRSYPAKKDTAGIFGSMQPVAAAQTVKPVAYPALYYQRLGFMCRQEWKLEKATKTSFRVRLGSVEYTDRMEGKTRPVPR